MSPKAAVIFKSAAITTRGRLEMAALVSLAGIFGILPIYDPQGADFFAVAFFLLGSLLIDQRDIDAADWTGRRPFVFACAAVILAIPFISGALSVNGFRAQVGSAVYIVAAPPAIFLVASRARFHLVGPDGMRRLILIGIFIGLIPAAIYGLVVAATPPAPFYLPGQPALNITAAYLCCMSAITLILTANLGRRARFLGYLAVVAMFALGLLTASRTFIAAAILILGTYALVIRHKRVLLIEEAVIMAVIVPLLAASYFMFRGSLTRLVEELPLGFFDGRPQTWADAIELFRRYPAFGIGPHTFNNTALNPLYVERTQQGIKFEAFYHAHNIFLNTLAEGGIVVGILLLVLIAAAMYGCYVVLKDNRENQFGWIAVALLTVFLVVGLFENTLVRPLIFPLAMFLGLAMNVTWSDLLRSRKAERVPLSAQP